MIHESEGSRGQVCSWQAVWAIMKCNQHLRPAGGRGWRIINTFWVWFSDLRVFITPGIGVYTCRVKLWHSESDVYCRKVGWAHLKLTAGLLCCHFSTGEKSTLCAGCWNNHRTSARIPVFSLHSTCSQDTKEIMQTYQVEHSFHHIFIGYLSYFYQSNQDAKLEFVLSRHFEYVLCRFYVTSFVLLGLSHCCGCKLSNHNNQAKLIP